MMIQCDGYRGAFIEEYLEVSRIGKSVLSKLTLLENSSSISPKEAHIELKKLLAESNIIFLRVDGKYIHKNGKFASEKFVKKALDSVQSTFSGFNKLYYRAARKVAKRIK